jgi:hypothetical protein
MLHYILYTLLALFVGLMYSNYAALRKNLARAKTSGVPYIIGRFQRRSTRVKP